jgi:hypothetical protein
LNVICVMKFTSRLILHTFTSILPDIMMRFDPLFFLADF